MFRPWDCSVCDWIFIIRVFTMSEKGALAYWFDIAPEVRDEWLGWYLSDHMPSRVGTVFTAGRCYEAMDASASHMVLFETPTAEDLLAPSYLALLSQVSDSDRQRRAWYSNTVRATCRMVSNLGQGIGGVLGVVRIQGANANQYDMKKSFSQDVLPLLLGLSSIGSATVMCNDPDIRKRMDQVRVTGHQDGSTDWVLLIEAGHENDIRRAWQALSTLTSWQQLHLEGVVNFDLYRLLYAMVQSDDRAKSLA
jgi:hypothetical protein